MGKKINCTDKEIIEAAEKHKSATAAAASLGIQYGTYRKHAERLGVFRTNQSGLGIQKPILDDRKINLDDILGGKHPQYQSNKLSGWENLLHWSWITLMAIGTITKRKTFDCYAQTVTPKRRHTEAKILEDNALL